MKIFILSFITVILSFTAYLYFYLGFTDTVTNNGIVNQEFYLLGKKHIGPYYKINEVITSVENTAKNLKLPCTKTFGLYIDNPQISEENRLRSEGGCLSFTSPYTINDDLGANFFAKKIESRKYLLLKFSGSPAISPFKVYPAAEEWFKKTNYEPDKTVIEVYVVGGNNITTYYYFPIKD